MKELLERVNFDLMEAAFLGPAARCQHRHGGFMRCPDPCLESASHRVIVTCGGSPDGLWCGAVVDWHNHEKRWDATCAWCGRFSRECWKVLPI